MDKFTPLCQKFVIAHEVAHFKERHALSRQKLIGTIVTDVKDPAQKVQLEQILYHPAVHDQAIAFELQADAIAGKYLVNKGYSTQDVLNCLKSGPFVAGDTLTHPGTGHRFLNLRQALAQ